MRYIRFWNRKYKDEKSEWLYVDEIKVCSLLQSICLNIAILNLNKSLNKVYSLCETIDLKMATLKDCKCKKGVLGSWNHKYDKDTLHTHIK